MSNQQLNYVNTDFNELVRQLVDRLLSVPDSPWRDTYRSGTGQMLIEFHAYVAQLVMYYLERRASEMYLPTAQLRSSLLNISRLMNYSPYRASSAVGTLTFYADSPLDAAVSIPEGTLVKSSSGLLYHTKSKIEVQPGPGGRANGATIQAVQGQWVIKTTTGSGEPNQRFVLTDTDIAQGYFEVSVNGRRWQQVDSVTPPSQLYRIFSEVPELRDTLWDERSQNPQAFIQSLLQADGSTKVYRLTPQVNGSLAMEFGDGVFGAVPALGDSITIRYLKTDGAAGNVFVDKGAITEIYQMGDGSEVPGNISVDNGLTVPDNTGNYQGYFTGGSAEESDESIRANVPRVFKTGDRAITREDFLALLRGFATRQRASEAETLAGVQSVDVWGEREESPIAPLPTAANKVFISALLDRFEAPSQAWKDSMIRYLYNQSVVTVLYEWRDPRIVLVAPRLRVRITRNYRLESVAAQIREALEAQFVLGKTTELGLAHRLSDLYAVVENVPGVDYVRLDLQAKHILTLDSSGAYVTSTVDQSFNGHGSLLTPWVPEEIRLTVNGQLVAKDDGDGAWVLQPGSGFTGITGSIDRLTGEVTATLTPAPAAEAIVAVLFQQDPEELVVGDGDSGSGSGGSGSAGGGATWQPTGETGDLVVARDQVCALKSTADIDLVIEYKK